MARYAVLGATSWGLTLASLLLRNQNEVVVVTRSDQEASRLSRVRGLARLPELRLPEIVDFVPPGRHGQVQGVVVAVPAQSLRKSVSEGGFRDIPVLSAAKGLEHATMLRMSEVLVEAGCEESSVAAISGPNLAHEIARGLPAAAVVASKAPEVAAMWQKALAGPTFRVYTSSDVVGVELAGAYKNVIAIVAGVAWGLNFGANTVASMMTRGLAEMSRLGAALGAEPATFLGLAGVGDLATTCFSPLSRNRRFGELLASGLSAEAARVQIGEAVEGAETASVALALAGRHGVELPICSEVVAVVRGEKSVMNAMASLLSRPLRDEAASAG